MDLDKVEVRQVFELEKTAVNQTDLAKRISNNLKAHQLKSPAHWPTFALTTDASNNESFATSDLRKTVNSATKEYDKIWLELSIPASDKSFVARLKRPFHQLVLFYVNRIGQKQIKFNDRLLRAINHLVASEEKKNNEIKELRKQLADLQKRIAELEQNH